MKRIGVALLAGAMSVSAAQSQNSLTRGLERKRQQGEYQQACLRIIGGTCAQPGMWPWQVALYLNTTEGPKPFCGGSLISDRFVLTAAHCLVVQTANGGKTTRDPDTLLVHEDTLKVRSEEGRKIRVKRVIAHEGWSPTTWENDIALIELAEPARSMFVALNSVGRADLETPGTSSTITGWGYTREVKFDPKTKKFVDAKDGRELDRKEFQTDTLQQVDLNLVAVGQCKTKLGARYPNHVIDQRSVCADTSGGKDSCQGDSGGPLVVRDRENRWVQVGITSWGHGCAREGYPGIYTRVASFEPWLRQKTAISQEGQPQQETKPVVENNVQQFTNDAGVAVSFAQGPSLAIGQPVNVQVSTNQGGYLYVVDVLADGKVTQLYPNEYSLAGRTAAARAPEPSMPKPIQNGARLVIPNPRNPYEGFAYKIDGPPGAGKLVAVLSERPLNDVQTPTAPRTFSTRRDALSYLGLLFSNIRREDASSTGEQSRVSVATFDYTISQ